MEASEVLCEEASREKINLNGNDCQVISILFLTGVKSSSSKNMLSYFEIVTVKRGHVIFKEDPSDDMFIRCALAGKAEIIISGDRHLLALKSYGGLKIVTPSQFLKQY